MIFLLFHCMALDENIILNEEFTEYKWVQEDEIQNFEFNKETIDTIEKIGNWSDIWK